MSKFKVGDIVEAIDDEYGFIGKGAICIIDKISEKGDLQFKGLEWVGCVYDSDSFVLVKQMKLKDIKDRWLVVFANGQEAIKDRMFFRLIEEGKYTSQIINIFGYNQDLKHKDDKNFDIVEVYKPEYQCEWVRKDITKKKMTVEEISKQLGYEIEII